MQGRRVTEVFDDWAARGRAEGMERGHGQTARPALAALRLGPADRLLDLGTGNGWACRRALADGAAAVGIDLSRAMLRQAGVPVARADGARLPFRDGVFTAAWSMEAIYYAPDPDQVLEEMRRVLRPGSSVHVLLDHYLENPASHGWPTDMDVPMVLRSEAQWGQAFEEAGFHDVVVGRLRAADPAAEAWKREQGTLWVQARA